MEQIAQNSTNHPLTFLMVDSSDHVSGKTGLSPNVFIRKVGGAFTTPSGAVSEITNGWYQVAANATDTNTLGPLLLRATATGADPTDLKFQIINANQDLQAAQTNANVTQFNGLTNNSIGGRPEVNVQLFGGITGTFAAGRAEVNTTHFGGVAGTFAAGRAEVNTTHFGGLTNAFIGGRPEVNVQLFGGITGTFANGRPEVNTTHFGGVAGTFAAGRPEVNTTYFGGQTNNIIGGRPEVNVQLFGGITGTFASGRPDVNAAYAGGIAWNSGAISASTLATDTITAAKLAADAGTEIATAVGNLICTELSADPGAAPTIIGALALLYMNLRNDTSIADGTNGRKIRNNAGSVILQSTPSDNGTTFTQGKLA